MELINNIGPIGKFFYSSNVATLRYLGYYFDEHVSETNFYSNTFMVFNTFDKIPDNTTCIMINLKISVEQLKSIICDTQVTSVILFKDMIIDDIGDKVFHCRNITSIVCYSIMSLKLLKDVFPDVRYAYLFRQIEPFSFKVDSDTSSATTEDIIYDFDNLKQLHIFGSISKFQLNAPNLEQLSIYSWNEGTISGTKVSRVNVDKQWTIDTKTFPNLHTIRIDESIALLNLDSKQEWKIIQFYPSKKKIESSGRATSKIYNFNEFKVLDLILPPTIPYSYQTGIISLPPNTTHKEIVEYRRKINNSSTIVGVYVNDLEFFSKNFTISTNYLQIFDDIYPLKMCSLRLSNAFYLYFPFPNEVNNELLEKFNIPKQRNALITIFNFDFMKNISKSWQSFYRNCSDVYHRVPIIIQNGQLMLSDGSNEEKQITWPNVVKKIRKECVIFLPEEELIYINCSPLRLQTLVDKIIDYRNNNFKINKLWLVTNGFELNTKDIEDSVQNLVIVNNEVKMYISF